MTVAPVASVLEKEYAHDIDQWVGSAVSAGVHSFARLVHLLPGVYPTDVLASLRRMSERGLIDRAAAGALQASSREAFKGGVDADQGKLSFLPLPHPLDFDWRFSGAARTRLVALSSAQRSSEEMVILLGAPTLLEPMAHHVGPDRVVLLDRNEVVLTSIARFLPGHRAIRCDLCRDPLPAWQGDLVVADPPWYEDHLHGFLWAASSICSPGGTIALSIPPKGTRPGVLDEIGRLLGKCDELGLALSGREAGALPYVSPPFERSALRALGITNLALDWRRGDLVTFMKVGENVAPRPEPAVHDEAWTSYAFRGLDVRVRGHRTQLREFLDPAVRPVVQGDVLPSVSRRDPRRSSVALWTSTNRVLASAGTSTLHYVVLALTEGKSANELISQQLQRALSPGEVDLVTTAYNAVRDLLQRELVSQQSNA